MAAAGTIALWDVFFSRVPFALFFAAVGVTAWYTGLMAAVAVALVSAVATARLMHTGAIVDLIAPAFLFGIACMLAYLLEHRSRAERALAQRSEQIEAERRRLSAVLEQMPLGVILAEAPSGRLLMANKAATSILRHPVVQTAAINDYTQYHAVYPDGRPYAAQDYPLVRALTHGETVVNEELAYVCGDGVSRMLTINAAPIYNGGEQIVAGLAVFADVSEAKAQQSQLLHSQRLESVGRLAGGVAHDFNNLLTVILGFGALALEEVEESHPVHDHVVEMRQAAQRATALTHQLLAFSRRQILQPRVLDLNQLVDQIGKMLSRLIGEDVNYETRLMPNLWHVKADPGQLEQIIVNLALNARDAMPNGGRLTLETANAELDTQYAQHHVDVRPGRYVMLAVSDTGHGMDRDTQARVFEPFFTTKGAGHGTGLGLSTVYGIVRQSGGNIWVYSEPGRGTIFKIYLPREDAKADPIPAASTKALGATGSEIILLVEDEHSLRDLTRRILSRAGYTVLDCQSADEALFISKSYGGHLHLLLTDVVLEGASGRQLADQLTSLRPGVKVLFMSGYTDNAIVHHGVLDPGVAFLEKPFSPDKLLTSVRQVLDAPR